MNLMFFYLNFKGIVIFIPLNLGSSSFHWLIPLLRRVYFRSFVLLKYLCNLIYFAYYAGQFGHLFCKKKNFQKFLVSVEDGDIGT